MHSKLFSNTLPKGSLHGILAAWPQGGAGGSYIINIEMSVASSAGRPARMRSESFINLCFLLFGVYGEYNMIILFPRSVANHFHCVL